MPKKYQINVGPSPSRFEAIPEYSTIESGICLHCTRCVRLSSCVYDVDKTRGFDYIQLLDPGDYQCKGCMRCIQECKGNILTRVRNSRFDAMGDEYWKPEIIKSIWSQAENGRIPVSGAGYRGQFTGPGFDQIWTDMSEIVRPTRDGIHGREYISTAIDLGRKTDRLEFDDNGNLLTEPPPLHEIHIPIILDIPHTGIMGESTRQAVARAATELGTLAVTDYEETEVLLSQYHTHLVARLKTGMNSIPAVDGIPVIELVYTDDVMDMATRIKKQNPNTLISIQLLLDEYAAERASRLAGAGAEIIHLYASNKGRGLGQRHGDFITNLVREIHLRLVDDSVREQLTLLASGGIAMAEHVAKTILCGADGVGIDLVMLVAMECRLCRECGDILECPVQLDRVPVDYGARRIVNLVGSWHSQLIEVMGAMGIREVRRLRGEIGRAMFFQDLEKDNFSPIFGERNQGRLPPHDRLVVAPTPQSSSDTWDFPLVDGLVNHSPTRYRNQLNKFKVTRSSDCIVCEKCSQVCTQGVHEKFGNDMRSTKLHLCLGPGVCREKGAFCGDACPQNVIRVGPDPIWETFGDPRWPADLLVSTWLQAETGRPPGNGLEYKVGASEGGFDRIDFAFPEKQTDLDLKPQDIDLSIPLNRRNDGRPVVEIGFPIYSGGMSFGSISLAVMIGKANAYKAFNSFSCTGEGGYPAVLKPYDDNMITQVATGLFGVSEDTIKRVRIVEYKYAQGAKPGLGGHLLGDKVTPAVARIRESVVGNSLFSPFPFHSVYSVEDHKKHLDWIKIINPKALVSVKVSSPTDVDMVAVGSYYAGAHIIHIDGSYGGTGAAPDIAKKNIAMPIEYAIPKVHRFLMEEGVRNQMTLVASGGIRTAWDIAKIIALGADAVVLGTSEMVALECIRCARCESGRGCPRGIATTDSQLSETFNNQWASQRLINLLNSYAIQLQEIIWRCGMRSVSELVGRTDLLVHLDYLNEDDML